MQLAPWHGLHTFLLCCLKIDKTVSLETGVQRLCEKYIPVPN